MLDLVKLTRAHHAESAAFGVPYSKEQVKDNASNLLLDLEREAINVWIAYEDEQPVGYIHGICVRYIYSPHRIASAQHYYVIPEKRGSRVFLKLVKKFEEWARLQGVLQILVGVYRTDKHEARRIGRLFPKVGYGFGGTYYLKNLVRSA